MIVYAYACDACGEETEVEAAMGAAPKQTRCRVCGSKAHRIFSSNVRPDLDSFHGENNGRGRWNDQLSCYVKSKQDTIDKAKARGWRPAG